MAVSWIVFACVFGGALLGMFLRERLPEHHLDADSKDVVKLGMALVATMSALLLSLLIASAKGSYDAQSREVMQMAAGIVELDRVLSLYGPESKAARDALRQTVLSVDRNWSGNETRTEKLDSATTRASGTDFFLQIQKLVPRNDTQRSLQAQAVQLALELARTRALLLEQTGSSIPVPFLVVLVFWLTVIFASFGLFAPHNATVVATLFVCALSVSGAIFLILELDTPFAGMLRISDLPIRNALTLLAQ
jgi:hypothetical protein